MKRILFIFLAIMVVLIGMILVVPFLVPSEVYKNQIESAATNALDREVELTGDVSISVFPRISASVGGVTVANPEGFSADNMIEAGALRGSVKWLPLLSRRVDVHEIAFVDANVSLERLEDGRANWEFGTGDTPADEPGTQNGESAVDAAIASARLVNASLTYSDATTGADYRLTDLDLRASMQAMDQPLKATAYGLFQDQPFDLSLSLNSPDTATNGLPAEASFALETALGNAAFDGTLRLGETPAIDGAFDVSSDNLQELIKFSGIDVDYNLALLGDVSANGTATGTLDALVVNVVSARQSSSMSKTRFAGTVSLTADPTITGSLQVETPNLQGLTNFARVDTPVNLTPLGAANIDVAVDGPLASPKLSFSELSLKGDLLDLAYTGDILVGETPQLNGTLKAAIEDAGALAIQMSYDLPVGAALKRIDLSTTMTGPVDTLALDNLDISHVSDMLSASYSGDVSMAPSGIALTGDVTAASSQLRALMAAAEVEMEPGDTLQSFDVKAALSGTTDRMTLSDMALKLDDIAATGTGAIDLTGDVPALQANVTTGAVDLTPFLGESDTAPEAGPANTGWSKTPLDLAGLKSVNADINLTTPSLTIGDITLTDAALAADLDSGRLSTNLQRFTAFGGAWAGNMIVNAQGAEPIVSFKMTGDRVAMSNLLGTLAGFDKLSGTGNFTVTAKSTGGSIDAIMQGLDGEVSTNLADGALQGLNVAQLVRSASSLQDALTSGNLQNLDFTQVLSASAETDFTEFKTLLKIENGVAKVDLMKLLNPVLGIDGTGEINIGGQTLDVRLATAIDKNASGDGSVVQLNGIPVPIRLSGTWSNLKVSPDLSGIESALRAELGGQVRDEITNRVGDQLGGALGGSAGNIVGDLLGVPQREAAPETAPPPAPAPDSDEATPTEATEDTAEEPAPPQSLEDNLEDAAEDLARDALGGLFGRKKEEQKDPAPTGD